jgi:hypothetical protein
MKQKRGRPSVVKPEWELAVAFALGKGLDPRTISMCLPMSSSTACRFAERLIPADVPGLERLLLAIHEHERRNELSKTHNSKLDDPAESI